MPQIGDVLSIFAWFAVAAVAILVGFCLSLAVRRWAQREDRTETFTIQDLREMRARGEITDPEFAAMRAALLARNDVDSGGAAADADAGAPPPEAPSSR